MAETLTHTNSATTTLDLNDGTIYTLLDIRGIYSHPGAAVLTPSVRRHPVSIYQGFNPTDRLVEIDLWIGGATVSALLTNLRALWAHFYPDMRDDSTGVMAYTSPNAISRSIRVTPPEGATGDASEWWVPNATAQARARVTLRLRAPDPTFYSGTVVNASGSFSGTGNVNISCVNPGDVDAYPTIVYVGGVTSPKVTDAYSKHLQIVQTLAGGETLTMVLNPQKGQLAITGPAAADWYHQMSSTSQLISVKHGTNNLVFVGGGGGDNATIAIAFYPRYSTHG